MNTKPLLPPNQKNHWETETPERKLFKAVCSHFENYGFSKQIETINDAEGDILELAKNEDGGVSEEQLKAVQDRMFRFREISNILAEMYQITNKYHYSGITSE